MRNTRSVPRFQLELLPLKNIYHQKMSQTVVISGSFQEIEEKHDKSYIAAVVPLNTKTLHSRTNTAIIL